jgi:FtsZ-binding cell division protein ZapB
MSQLDKLPDEWIERIFMRLHGRFGNTFFNKFKTGDLNANGEDAGIVNMKATWAYELRGITSTRIKAGLDASYDKAPDCDLFKSKCVLQAEIQDYKAVENKLSDEEIEANKKKLEKINADLTRKSSRDWVKYWNAFLDNPNGVQEITLSYAREALINLGHPYQSVKA